jgi:hypothetical protein
MASTRALTKKMAAASYSEVSLYFCDDKISSCIYHEDKNLSELQILLIYNDDISAAAAQGPYQGQLSPQKHIHWSGTRLSLCFR